MRHDHARRQSCNTAITGFARAAEPGAGHRSLHVDCPILAAPRLTVRNWGGPADFTCSIWSWPNVRS